ncbi:hypothetical protein PG996_010082 [Apiospora saccharicola]|uniref:Uncharacterized protein n=1 Tax=Apiospora saccharicola TaxID=335842 RepID=A0ABR1UMM2_9PEZI
MDENQSHGGSLSGFSRQLTKGGSKAGIPYKVEFTNGPSGTTDEDYFLGEDRSKNRCALPYGNAFLLINSAVVNKGERSHDPWWDDKTFEETLAYKTDSNGRVTASVTTMGVSAYCKYPSPGKKFWDGTQWLQHPLATSLPRKEKQGRVAYYSCDNYPGYAGPSGIPGATRRRGASRGL